MMKQQRNTKSVADSGSMEANRKMELLLLMRTEHRIG
jgi:hypothetical protein